tara:strand:- start:4223 stop:5032 length:810 start_codon:yes stop_codon:yes gene_type:complete
MTNTELIAEIGWNHMGDMVLAKEMIKAASEAGADYAKFQTWSVSRLKAGPWDNDGRREIYIKAELKEEQHYELKEYCDSSSIKFMSSVFSVPDAELLHKVMNDYVKIPSAESRNTNLLDFVNNNFKKVLISTGTSTLDEIKRSIDILDNVEIVLLHCVSSYPCHLEGSNLPRINHLKSLNNKIGYSDHVEGIEAAKISLEFDIEVIEKHFTIDNDLPGRDNKFAILPDELKSLADYISSRQLALVDNGQDYLESEKEVREVYSGRFDIS